ncbi:hypothetical protein BaRGS_00008414, partial [Batillaria attramentaria]
MLATLSSVEHNIAFSHPRPPPLPPHHPTLKRQPSSSVTNTTTPDTYIRMYSYRERSNTQPNIPRIGEMKTDNTIPRGRNGNRSSRSSEHMYPATLVGGETSQKTRVIGIVNTRQGSGNFTGLSAPPQQCTGCAVGAMAFIALFLIT